MVESGAEWTSEVTRRLADQLENLHVGLEQVGAVLELRRLSMIHEQLPDEALLDCDPATPVLGFPDREASAPQSRTDSRPTLFQLETAAELASILKIDGPFSAPGILLGTSAVTAAGWEGSFYPAGMKPRDSLSRQEADERIVSHAATWGWGSGTLKRELSYLVAAHPLWSR